MIEKDEGPDHATLCVGQDAADLETPKVAAPLLDDEIDHDCRCPFERLAR
jgi:hypothetical protein